MVRKDVDEDGVEELEGNDLKKAMKRLGHGPMRFAFGCKDGKPVLLMHPTKSAKALSQKLRSELGATKATHGTASADGKAVVLDVEGPRVSGMGRMVKTLLRKEGVAKYTQARVMVEGEEIPEDDGEDVPGGDDPALDALRELRARIQASEKQVAVILPRLGQGREDDRAFLLDYCRSSAELYRASQGCADPELAAYGKACSGRARKVAEYLKSRSGGQSGAGCAPAPAASLGGSVGKGGRNNHPDVALVQRLLAQKGYAIAADGLCGPATIAAITAFQRAHLGQADGLVEPGRNTWRALYGQPLVKPSYGGPGKGQYQKPGPGYGTSERRPRVEEVLGGSKRSAEDYPHYGVTEQSGGGDSFELSGSAYSEKTADGELDILSGKVEVDGDNVSASGTLARYKHGGTTDTVGQFEYKSGVFEDGDSWWAGKKVSEVDAKREVDFTEEFGLDDRIILKGDAAVGTASAEASISDQGLSIGAQANLAEASATIGTTGTGDQDQSVRVGASEGVGLAGRLHWGDADKDGNPEYGFGFDYGPASFDIKTEDPLRTAFQNSGGPITQAASELYDGNMTNDAMEAAAEAGAEVGGIADAASEWISGDSESEE